MVQQNKRWQRPQQRTESSAARDDEATEQEGPESEKKRTEASLPVCFLPCHVSETLASCLTTLEVDVGMFYENTARKQLTHN